MFGIGDAVAAGLKVLDKFIPDPAARAEAEAELRDALMRWDAAQLEVNKAEAAHRTIFVAGWRPWIGWTCGAAFSLHFVILPVAYVVAGMLKIEMPSLSFDMETLLTVLFGLLGLGGLRTFEKMKGVAK